MLFSDDICMIIKASGICDFFTFEFLTSDGIKVKRIRAKKIFLFQPRDRLNEEIKKEMEMETKIQIDGFDSVLSIKQNGSKTV